MFEQILLKCDEDMDESQLEPSVELVIPPKNKVRFQYISEGRTAASILGEGSTKRRKIYPTIRINGLPEVKKLVWVNVSCVDNTLRVHPYWLVGDNCHAGVYQHQLELDSQHNEVTFPRLGIQTLLRRDVAAYLKNRKTFGIDPFNKGFEHIKKAKSLNLSAVRLCFEVLLLKEAGVVERALPPLLSPLISNKKSVGDLKIVLPSVSAGPAEGGTIVFLLCDKVSNIDTGVVFYQEYFSERVWAAPAEIIRVHKQAAIVLKTPPYRDPNIEQPVQVNLQLVRISDNDAGEPIPFVYHPQKTVRALKKPIMPLVYEQNVDHTSLVEKAEEDTSRHLIFPEIPNNIAPNTWQNGEGPSRFAVPSQRVHPHHTDSFGLGVNRISSYPTDCLNDSEMQHTVTPNTWQKGGGSSRSTVPIKALHPSTLDHTETFGLGVNLNSPDLTDRLDDSEMQHTVTPNTWQNGEGSCQRNPLAWSRSLESTYVHPGWGVPQSAAPSQALHRRHTEPIGLGDNIGQVPGTQQGQEEEDITEDENATIDIILKYLKANSASSSSN